MVKNEGLQRGLPTRSAKCLRRKTMGRLLVSTTATSFSSSPKRDSKSAATCWRKGSIFIGLVFRAKIKSYPYLFLPSNLYQLLQSTVVKVTLYIRHAYFTQDQLVVDHLSEMCFVSVLRKLEIQHDGFILPYQHLVRTEGPPVRQDDTTFIPMFIIAAKPSFQFRVVPRIPRQGQHLRTLLPSELTLCL